MSTKSGDQVYVFPMSFAQQRLWLLEQLEEGNPAYNLAAAVEIQGQLDIVALTRSFQEIVRRHETLRTTFDFNSGEAVQTIAPEGEILLTHHELESLPADQRSRELGRRIREETMRPFDLHRGPLLRVSLLRQRPDQHTLLIVIHHIISDGWSMGVLSEELGVLYNAFSGGGSNPLSEPEVQYADYTCWQREWLEGEHRTQQLEYWQRQLEGAPTYLEFATDHPRPATQSFRGGTVRFAIEPKVNTALKTVCSKSGATLTMALLTGFFALLSRFCEASDIVVGTPVANRRRSEVERLIGFFVNTLPIRADLTADPSFRELLCQIRETCLDAWANQDVPFEQLVEALQPQRNLSRSPLFQVMFIVQNAPAGRLNLAGLEVRPLALEGHTAKYDLTLSLNESSGGLEGVIEYNADLFDEATARSMADCYQTGLAAAADHPDHLVSRLQMVPSVQLQRLSRDLNDTTVAIPELTVCELFERRASARPEEIAVRGGREQMTYRELNTGANQLAHLLRHRGMVLNTPVAICLDRSCRTVLAILGVLKAGGAFVPLDPIFPRDRLATMLEDSAAPLVVCETATSEAALAGLPVDQIVLDRDNDELARQSAHNPESRASGDDLAYVIFTSGSTGRAKGVQISHRALANFLDSMARRPGLDGDDVLLAVTTISFDIAVLELLLPLVQGARLIVAGRNEARDPERIAQMLEEEGATVMQATPATWRLLVASGWSGTRGLKVLCGGEALAGDLADALLACADSVWNMYGPTETTIWSAVHRVQGPCKTARSLPIGTPINNTQLYVLDTKLQLVPMGAPGELFIGGLGLARGYIGLPRLTSSCFLPNPIEGAPSARLYRTGDRVRFRADGSIEFLGRTDHQVKLRGFRIELGEIESALQGHPAVSEAVAILHEGSAEHSRLVAFVVLKPGVEAAASELGQHLRRRLPDYMVPGELVVVQTLPRTPNGKVDRNALRRLDVAPAVTRPSVAPRDELEAELCSLWQELFDRPQVCIRESFFDLGGHSLLALQLVALVRDRLGIEVPLALLFQHPTVEGLAAAVRGGSSARDPAPLVLLGGHGDGVPFFCVPGAGGEPLYMVGLARLVGAERQFYSFRAPGLDEGETAMTSIEALAKHYLQALRKVQPDGPYLLGGHSFGSRVAFELAQRLLRLDQRVALLVVFDTVAPVIDNPTAAWDEADLLADLAGIVSRLSGNPIDVSAREVRVVPSEHRLDTVWRWLDERSCLPIGVDSQTLRRLVEVYTTALKADYVVKDARPVPVALLRAVEKTPWHGDRPDELSRLLAEHDWGWGRLAAGEVDVVEIPGDHLSMFQDPNVVGVGQQLTPLLGHALGPGVGTASAPSGRPQASAGRTRAG